MGLGPRGQEVGAGVEAGWNRAEGGGFHVACAGVAGQAIGGPAPGGPLDDRHHRRVAMAAGGLGHPAVAFGDADVLGEAAGGEGKRMEEAVDAFGEVLGNQSGRGVTVVAHGDGAVATLDPAVELFVHDMAIRAGTRIVGEVRGTPGIEEGEATHAGGQAGNRTGERGEKGWVECNSTEHGKDALYRVGLARLEKANTKTGQRYSRFGDLIWKPSKGFHAFPRWSGPSKGHVKGRDSALCCSYSAPGRRRSPHDG